MGWSLETKRILSRNVLDCVLLGGVQLALEVTDGVVYLLVGLHNLPKHLQIHTLHIALIVVALLNELQLGSQRSILLL